MCRDSPQQLRYAGRSACLLRSISYPGPASLAAKDTPLSREAFARHADGRDFGRLKAADAALAAIVLVV